MVNNVIKNNKKDSEKKQVKCSKIFLKKKDKRRKEARERYRNFTEEEKGKRHQ